MGKIKLTLFDINCDLVKEWKNQFKDKYPNVEIKNESLGNLQGFDYIVAPGNSFGWMTGGIDLEFRKCFGMKLQDCIQLELITHFYTQIPIGSAVFVRNTHNKISNNVIYAPTMQMPQQITPETVGYVFSQVLTMLDALNIEGTIKVACPGLGTGTGQVSAKDCAYEMFKSYDNYIQKVESR